MEFKDYYEIPGVPQDADQKTIGQAYRKLARQHHPDVNPGNKDAEERFKQINEAYQALSNPEQRKKYDDLRAQYQRWQQTGRQPGGRPGQDFNWRRWGCPPGEGPSAQYTTVEDMEDLFGGESPFSDFFTSIFGWPRAVAAALPGRRGQDIEVEVEVPLEEAYRGGTRQIQIGDRRIEARLLPAYGRDREYGCQPGRAGEKRRSARRSVSGDPPPASSELRAGRDDLHTDSAVDIYTAVLGGEVPVPTLDRPVMLKIPPRTQSSRSFRLWARGCPGWAAQLPGRSYARARLVLPGAHEDREVNAFRELAAARGTRQPA